uniref:transposase n=1 Tax=Aidingimonas lacisalsi TaxID=2604086 RepID=UPI0038B395E3
MSNARILAVDDRQVTLRVKDYRDRDRPKRLVLAGEEFVRRFLLHVLLKGLMRVRHYGFLANRCRRLDTDLHLPALPATDTAGDRDTQPRAIPARPTRQPRTQRYRT